jgi:predicted Rossmann fold nucleotide-binding protein DprA/Smf involved in DNA uptake
MICGSRDATPAMLSFARLVTLRAWHMVLNTQWRIIVGDAHGVDEEVVRTCLTWGIAFTCCGIAQSPRSGAPKRHYQRIVTTASSYAERYRERDRYMIHQANLVVCISNGETLRKGGQPTGTLAVYEYAKHLGKRVYLRSFGETEVVQPIP